MTLIILLKALILNYFIKSTSKEFFNQDKRFSYKAFNFIKSKPKNITNFKEGDQKNITYTNKTVAQPRQSEIIQPREMVYSPFSENFSFSVYFDFWRPPIHV